MEKTKFFKCPYCKRDYKYRLKNEKEDHIKNCPWRHEDPKKFFDSRQKQKLSQ